MKKNIETAAIYPQTARAALFFAALAAALLIAGCSRTPTDMRRFAPAETLAYLETDDLGRLLESLTANRTWDKVALRKKDFSAVRGVQLAVAVTGFEATENAVTPENSVLNFKPRFVAVADTHAWASQTLTFAENTLGEFVNETYGGEVSLEMTEKAGGKSFVWTATDGRKVFAFVTRSRVFFSNDESALEKSLAVARGEADSLIGNEALAARRTAAKDSVAIGYIPADGVAQLANLAGVSTAVEATEDEDGRSFIARVLPQVLRNSVREVFWSAVKTEQGIEDRYSVALNQETANVFRETIRPSGQRSAAAEFVSMDAVSATRYSLENPLIAWRSLLLVAGKNSDQLSGRIIVAFSDSLLEPYGIGDSEAFLGSVGSEIWTVNFDPEGENSVVIATVRDAEKLKKSIAGIDFRSAPIKWDDTDTWRSDDNLTAAIRGDVLVLGDAGSVIKCLSARREGSGFAARSLFADRLKEPNIAAFTAGKDSTEKVVEMLGEKKGSDFLTTYTTETRFADRGFERRTVSPFGLVGRIIEQFDN